MEITNEIVRIEKQINFEAAYEGGHFHINYHDPSGDEKKKRLIEDLMNKTLDEAKKIIDSE